MNGSSNVAISRRLEPGWVEMASSLVRSGFVQVDERYFVGGWRDAEAVEEREIVGFQVVGAELGSFTVDDVLRWIEV